MRFNQIVRYIICFMLLPLPLTHADSVNPKLVCLRFDDGPRHEKTVQILDILKAENVKATFACIGEYVEKSPEVVKRILAEGHDVANHSHTHKNLTQMDEAFVREDLLKAQAAIEEACGVRPHIFFAPFNAFDDRLLSILSDLELFLPRDAKIYPALDWKEGVTADAIKQNLLELETGNGYLLIHDWSEKSISVLAEVIQTLKQRGYHFVTASELHAFAQKAQTQ